MKCSRCSRPLRLAALTSGGVVLGPTCARILGLAISSRKVKAVPQAGQLGLFEAIKPQGEMTP